MRLLDGRSDAGLPFDLLPLDLLPFHLLPFHLRGGWLGIGSGCRISLRASVSGPDRFEILRLWTRGLGTEKKIEPRRFQGFDRTAGAVLGRNSRLWCGRLGPRAAPWLILRRCPIRG
jgi:hypothetical protein